MESNADRRGDPLRLWPEAKSAIMVGQSYAPRSDPLDALQARERGIVSVYAKGRDYHDVLKSKIKSLARGFAAASGADVKVFVDTAPLMEKPLAAKAGLGWQGKHTNLVSRQHGSWLFLGAILTTADLEPDAAQKWIIAALASAAWTSVRRKPSRRPTSSTRAAASPTCRSNTRDTSRPSFVSPWAIACSAATIAWRSVRGTSLLPPRANYALRLEPKRTIRQ